MGITAHIGSPDQSRDPNPARELLSRLRADFGISARLSVHHPGQLCLRSRTGALTPELRGEIETQKAGLLALLAADTAPSPAIESETPTAPPYLTPAGDLCIPFDSPPRFRWWLPGGQFIAATLAELDAPAEVDGMLSKLTGNALGVVLAAFRTGMRLRELTAFDLAWCDFERSQVRIPNTLRFSPKSHKGRPLPLSEDLGAWVPPAAGHSKISESIP